MITFLKSNSSKRGELATDSIVNQIVRLIFNLNDYFNLLIILQILCQTLYTQSGS